MKKLLVLTLLSIPTLGFTQNHLKSQKALSVTTGYVSLGSEGETPSIPLNRFSLYFDHIISNQWYEKMGVTYHYGKVGLVDFNQILGTYKVGFNLFSERKFFVNAIGGPSAGYESVVDFENNTTNKFIYGVNLGSEVEYFISPKFGVTFQAAQSIYFNSQFQLDKIYYLQYNFNFGLKFVL